jgi:hypothetical protein
MVLHLKEMVFIERYLCFVNIAESAYLQQNERFSTFKPVICMKYSF